MAQTGPVSGTMGAMATILIRLLDIVVLLFVARAILSWFPIGFDSPVRPVVDFLWSVTEPILAPIRRFLPPLGGLDLSVLVVIFGIRLVLVPLIRGAL